MPAGALRGVFAAIDAAHCAMRSGQDLHSVTATRDAVGSANRIALAGASRRADARGSLRSAIAVRPSPSIAIAHTHTYRDGGEFGRRFNCTAYSSYVGRIAAGPRCEDAKRVALRDAAPHGDVTAFADAKRVLVCDLHAQGECYEDHEIRPGRPARPRLALDLGTDPDRCGGLGLGPGWRSRPVRRALRTIAIPTPFSQRGASRDTAAVYAPSK